MNSHQARQFRMRRGRYPVGLILFVLFTGFTLLEIWLIFLLASWISWPMTILVAIVSALLGSWMAKREGLAVIARAKAEMGQGRFPGGELADGVMILIGGALLITPGLITDLIGFTTLIPACRKVYRAVVIKWAKKHLTVVTPGSFAFGGGGFGPGRPRGPVSDAEPGTYGSTPANEDPDVVDVEFRRTE